MTDRLRLLWDFDDLDATEQRFRTALAEEPDAVERAELLTQLARVYGLRGEFESGEQLLAEAESIGGASDRCRARIDLERGRLLRSAGDPDAAYPLFESAFETAKAAGELYIAGDAAHMAAIAGLPRESMLAWTERGVELAESGDGSGAYWLGPLLNNLGWDQYEAGEYEAALASFERALAARERDPANRAAIVIARYAVAKTLRALERPAEAASALEPTVAWTQADRKPDGWVHEELAEIYAALGRNADAAEHAGLALSLLPDMDGSFVDDERRVARLRELAGDG